MTEALTIHIPFDLARFAVWQRKRVNKYETNAVIKALDTWLVLKHETRSGFLQQWNKQKDHLLQLCKVSESVFRCRLKILQGLKLLKYDRQNIRLYSWTQLANVFEIDVQQKFTIQYNVNNKQRVQDWLIATEIKDNQNRQSYKIIQKLNNNPAYKQAVVTALLKAGADRYKLKDLRYVLMWLQILYRNDFVRASDIHSVLIEIRPDINRGVKGIAEAWKCKGPQTISYWKGILQRAGIIDVAKLQIESTQRVRNSECKVLWLRNSKQTLLCLCDQITVLQSLKSISKDNTGNEDTSHSNLSAA